MAVGRLRGATSVGPVGLRRANATQRGRQKLERSATTRFRLGSGRKKPALAVSA
jgi:hypothetical protein